MQRKSDNERRSRHLRRRATAALLVLLACIPVLARQPYRVPTRGPAYPPAAAGTVNLPAEPKSAFGKFKHRIGSLFDGAPQQAVAGETESRNVVEAAAPPANQPRNPLDALKRTFSRNQAPAPADRGPATLAPSRRAAVAERRDEQRISRYVPIAFDPVERSITGAATESRAGRSAGIRPVTRETSAGIVTEWPPAPSRAKGRNAAPIAWASGTAVEPEPAQQPVAVDNPSAGPEPRTIDVPLNDAGLDGRITFSTSQDGRISLIVREAPLEAVLDLIAQQQGLNIVTAGAAVATVSATLTNVSLDDALNSILSVAGYTWVRQKDIIVVSPITADIGVAPHVQGRTVRVFPLSYVSATDVQQIVIGLLSPAGKSFVTTADASDRRRTRELLIVEDLPGYVKRVEEYIAQVDQPPRQVQIEAHVLRVDLSDETRHGVDFSTVAKLANADITLRTQGFANPAASPAFFLGVDGTDLDAFVEAIKATTDAKTLASPKVLVINGQDARIQIGERFGYLVTTTTQTSTLQNVDFLDVGVVLSVTPQISSDNQVLMTVKPEVSSGRINALTGLPEEETTEVETTVMLPDGQGIVIGGLIQETDSDRQTKVPILGDLWLVGTLFQRKAVLRERSEIVIALIPRIVPYTPDYDLQTRTHFDRATTRLFNGPLWKSDRPWEPVLPDAMRNPRRPDIRRVPHVVPNLIEPTPHPPSYYFPTIPEREHWLPPLFPIEVNEVPFEEPPPFDEFAVPAQPPFDEFAPPAGPHVPPPTMGPALPRPRPYTPVPLDTAVPPTATEKYQLILPPLPADK